MARDLEAGQAPTGSAKPVTICGAGGHARVVADVLSSRVPPVSIAGFLDDRADLLGAIVLGKPVLGSLSQWLERTKAGESDLIIGIGDNRVREQIALTISEAGFKFLSAVHSSAQIGAETAIGHGTVIMPNVVINTGARIGSHVIVNTGATVDHDCVVEDFSHISPGVNLAGGVTVGQGAHVAIGASVVPGVRIGDWALIGAGATVTKDVPPNTTVVGTRAVPVRLRRTAQ